MPRKRLIRFLCAILALAVAAQGLSIHLAADSAAKTDVHARPLTLSPTHAVPVYCALLTQKTRYPTPAQVFLGLVHKSQTCDTAQLDRLTHYRQSQSPLPVAENPTLLALNCMLTV